MGSGRERVLVAMSGGVDSSVAAARLADAGYDVVGCTLHLWDYEDESSAKSRCCAPEDQVDAQRVSDAVGFPHYVFDRRALFAKTVVEPFVDAYLAGDTPSPCTACNRGVKLGELFAIADNLGASHVATGHYARIFREGTSGRPFLARGRDQTKDQSYFLFATPPAQLGRLLFPLGDSTKSEVRAEAIARALPGAEKGESQELCFVGSGAGAYARFIDVRGVGRVRPGPIVDQGGRVVGQHDGIHRFTIGQRKGIGVALGTPAFVTQIDAASGEVRLGDEDALLCVSAELEDVVLAEGVTVPMRAVARVRYRHHGAAAQVTSVGTKSLRVIFDEPVRAVTRGQTAVFYDGDRVLGGGRIARVTRRQVRAAAGVSP